MGRGNTCVHGEFEGLYFVDYDYLDYYVSKETDDNREFQYKLLKDMTYEDFDAFECDEFISSKLHCDFVDDFIELFNNRFNSFEPTGKHYGVIMENSLFEIVLEDNEWSYAVKLVQKESGYYECLSGLQKRHYQNYLNGIHGTISA